MKITVERARRVCCIVVSCLLTACSAEKQPQTTASTARENTVTQAPLKDIQITTLKEAPANAPKPQKGNVVIVHYTGWLQENGKKGRQFDSSVSRGEPFAFPVGHGMVIKGWDKGLLEMAKGGTYEIVIPAEMGYGSRGAGGVIPPHATLIFEIQVIDIKS